MGTLRNSSPNMRLNGTRHLFQARSLEPPSHLDLGSHLLSSNERGYRVIGGKGMSTGEPRKRLWDGSTLNS